MKMLDILWSLFMETPEEDDVCLDDISDVLIDLVLIDTDKIARTV